MTAPNIVNVATITGKSTGLALGTSQSTIISNSSGSNQLFKINYLNMCNYSINTQTSNVNIVKSSGTVYQVLGNVSIAAGSVLVGWGKDTALYMEEGDTLQANVSTAGTTTVTLSYEIIS
jgi:hypothetical protein